MDIDMARLDTEAGKEMRHDGVIRKKDLPRRFVISEARAAEEARAREAVSYPDPADCGLVVRKELLRREIRGYCEMVRMLIAGDEPHALEEQVKRTMPAAHAIIDSGDNGRAFVKVALHDAAPSIIVEDVFVENRDGVVVGEAHLCNRCRERFHGLYGKLLVLNDAQTQADQPGSLLPRTTPQTA
jgi:hypothetical protein